MWYTGNVQPWLDQHEHDFLAESKKVRPKYLEDSGGSYVSPNVKDFGSRAALEVVLVNTAGALYDAGGSGTVAGTVTVGGGFITATIGGGFIAGTVTIGGGTISGSVTTHGRVDVLRSSAASVGGYGKVIGTTAAQLDSLATRFGVLVRAAEDNAGTIAIGVANTVTLTNGLASTGIKLSAGQAISYEIDNASLLWAIASQASQHIEVAGD